MPLMSKYQCNHFTEYLDNRWQCGRSSYFSNFMGHFYCHQHRPLDFVEHRPLDFVEQQTPYIEKFTYDNRYFNGKIYRLKHPDFPNDILYVGQTIQSLPERVSQHIHDSLSEKFMTFRNNHDIKKMMIELIEDYPCYNKLELSYREQHWINSLNPLLNSINSYSDFHKPPPIDYTVLEEVYNNTFDNIYYDDLPTLIET